MCARMLRIDRRKETDEGDDTDSEDLKEEPAENPIKATRKRKSQVKTRKRKSSGFVSRYNR